MKRIPLSKGKHLIVDDADFPLVSKYKWRILEPSPGLFYAASGVQTIYAHRLISGVKDSQKVDHRNHNGLDNRRKNLRICTHQQNISSQLLSTSNTSGFKGVSKKRNKWGAWIGYKGKTIFLGTTKTAFKAARLYDLAAVKYFGEFALTNKMLGLYAASTRSLSRLAA